MKWIGKGVLKLGRDKSIGYGEDIPPKALSKEQIEAFKVAGQIGAVIIKAEPGEDAKAQVKELNRQIAAMKAQVEEAEAKVEATLVELAEMTAIAEKATAGGEK